MSHAAARQPGIQALARAGSILRALEEAPQGLGLAELAKAVALPKSTVHRLAGALASEGLVATAGGRLVLGGAIPRLAAASRRTLPQRLRPALEELSAQLGETVDLAVLDGSAVRFVDQIPGSQRLRAVSAVGAGFPLHCTANGKALLAALDPEDARALLPARLPRLTSATIVSRAALSTELEEIRGRGVAFDHEEHTEGIGAVGVAIHDGAGPVAALSVPVPMTRFRGAEQHYAQAALTAALDASELLGAAG
ncbi:MAG TPA: IclR family transcriptional regulator [Solirubrobacteraceae bacterium]|jgi:DNA-binding IclR family transcriptional regulator|nr:IclR family transcriptional regulator [Solirubrobacteraceae bacterium]